MGLAMGTYQLLAIVDMCVGHPEHKCNNIETNIKCNQCLSAIPKE